MLERVQRVTERLEAEPSVLRVISLANATQVRGIDGDIEVGPFFEEPPTDPASLGALRAAVLAHPIYGDALVAADGRATALVVFLEAMDAREFVTRDISGHLAGIAREEAGVIVLVTGNPHIKAELGRTIVSELGLILPLVAGITALLCLPAFRSARGVLLPVAAIGMSLVWTLGAMGWTGTPLNLVYNIIPPLLITLCFASAMHVMSEYYEVLERAPVVDRAGNTAAVVTVLREMGLAIFVNGMTTLLGFLSLCTSTVLAIRQFGLWSVIGVLTATLVSLVFIPALLVLLGPPRQRHSQHAEGRLERWAGRMGEFDVRNRRLIFTLVFGVLAVAVFGITRLQVSSSFVGSFVASSPIRTTFETLNERLGGLSSFFIVVEADENQAFSRPENLRELRKLQEWLEAQPEIGSTASLADGVMLLNQAFNDNDAAAFDIPARQGLLRELLFFGGEDLTAGFVDGRLRTANITVRAKISDSGTVAAFMERVQDRLDQLPKRLHARPTGDLVLLSHTMDDITRGMLSSSGTAFLTIYLTLCLLLTSFRVGLYALVPNLVPVALYYGALGLTGIPLNLSTSLIGVITLGIAVDDTVHYFARFALEARRLGNEKKATVSTLRAVIRPVTFTTVGLCLGFLALTASELRNQVEFGLLSAFTLMVGWVLERTLSPAICSGVRLVTLWDVLTLDLCHEPQRSVPLFQGLTKRQARIFALMSSTVQLESGKRLFAEGDKGDEMFIIIDGELTASLEREGQRVEFNRMHRGDVVGEVALFAQGRSADVDVTGDARLLRFGETEFARLRQRYPTIAAVVYANLSRILAARITNTIKTLR
ncbi:MAG: cyclic nucleotide-binding domain-containing protein [Gammaproteobacteria bacterium]|nr:cyclic nucleotide-binding domain-containing protein [Gammaproteobacteria bacterium]